MAAESLVPPAAGGEDGDPTRPVRARLSRGEAAAGGSRPRRRCLRARGGEGGIWRDSSGPGGGAGGATAATATATATATSTSTATSTAALSPPAGAMGSRSSRSARGGVGVGMCGGGCLLRSDCCCNLGPEEGRGTLAGICYLPDMMGRLFSPLSPTLSYECYVASIHMHTIQQDMKYRGGVMHPTRTVCLDRMNESYVHTS